MKALVKFASGAGNVEIRDIPEPQPADNQVKIEIVACGICGTDLHVYDDTFRNYPPVFSDTSLPDTSSRLAKL